MSGYAELAVTTNFSFLRGASAAEELVAQAKELGLSGIGIADRNTVAGVVRAHVAIKELLPKEAGLKLAVGARLVFADGTPDILAYPASRQGWGHLCRLLTSGKLRAGKSDCILTIQDLLDRITALNLIVCPPQQFKPKALLELLARLNKVARGSIWLGTSMLYRGDDSARLARLASIGAEADIPLIAIGDVLYHVPERRALQDVVTCIREHLTIDQAGRRLEMNAERHLKSPAEMVRLFRKAPSAILETQRFLKQCDFSLDQLQYEYPDETREGYATPQQALVALTEQGMRRRFPDGIPLKVQKALAHELAL
ncbi:MAG TPA: PHP domain-containing protein, partial [Xanthobacteraceae bacterium]|nr:PHP domain-containing protein [Xanthobacteraceae bacterium]